MMVSKFYRISVSFIKSNWIFFKGNTCVQLAAFNNDTKLLEMLVLSGANINVQVVIISFENECLLT